MAEGIPEYLSVPGSELGRDQPVHVYVVEGAAALAHDMALSMAEAIRDTRRAGRPCTLIVPVGPVDQYGILAGMVNAERLSCRDTVFINMDEYLTEQGEWASPGHPLSFRSFMNRCFYEQLDPELAPPVENRVFPDPRDLSAVPRLIATRGGVDVCFGGIGINGHLAFNEPPEPGETCSLEAFAALPTRVVSLARETRTINAVTVGGDIAVVPRLAVTVGMNEILGARALRFYCNRPWQSGVVRRALHGPITPACPASLLRLHGDASLTVADYVAATPNIRLR
jgi:glucosamine-6-phosphate deaminase